MSYCNAASVTTPPHIRISSSKWARPKLGCIASRKTSLAPPPTPVLLVKLLPSEKESGWGGCEKEPPEDGDRHLNLEVREEILGTQVDDEGSDGPRLVEGIVDEETPCGERTERP